MLKPIYFFDLIYICIFKNKQIDFKYKNYSEVYKYRNLYKINDYVLYN